MTAAEFKRKWARFSGKESAAYQEHFNDLCRLLGQPRKYFADKRRPVKLNARIYTEKLKRQIAKKY